MLLGGAVLMVGGRDNYRLKGLVMLLGVVLIAAGILFLPKGSGELYECGTGYTAREC